MRVRLGFVVAAIAASVASAEAQRPPAPPPPPPRPAPPAPPARPAPPPAYQGQSGADQTERFSRRVRIGRDGRFSINNIAGDIIVTSGSGDEVSIEAVKRTRGDQRELADIRIEVDAGNGRVDVRSVYPPFNGRITGGRRGSNDRVRVDYTIAVPGSTEVDAKSVSGNVKITGVQGPVRAETISGTVTTAGTPRLELAKSVSGDVDISDIATDRGLTVGSISGTLRGRNVKARSLDLNTVSGDMTITDAACERIDGRSISGNIEYSGSLARNGRYDLNSHSGNIRLTLPGSPGFSLTANTFSGTIRSDLPLTIGGDANRTGRQRGFNGRSVQAAFGDGTAGLTIRTFSGDIIIARR
jgi:DUF4097 and DUF4098 domain-containing protein YvlB